MFTQVLEVVVCGALFMAAFAATVGVVALGIRVLGRVVEWMGRNKRKWAPTTSEFYDPFGNEPYDPHDDGIHRTIDDVLQADGSLYGWDSVWDGDDE